MKKNVAVLFVSIPLAAAAGDVPLGFPTVKIDTPSFSLIDDALQKAPAFVSDFDRLVRAAPARTAIVSHMPIISPKGDADIKILKEPEPSTDYKLSVKSPVVEPAK